MSFLTKLFSSPKRQSTTIPTTPVSDDWELISSLEAVSDVGDNTPSWSSTWTVISTPKLPPTSVSTSASTATPRSKPSPTTQNLTSQPTQPTNPSTAAASITTKAEREAEEKEETESEKWIKHHPLNQRYQHSRLNILKGRPHGLGVKIPRRQPAVPPRVELLKRGMVKNFVWGRIWGA
ncbi:hypothetical protein PtrSN002B_003217 [Pyrenophora tritici-repentis]|uniref:Uncharacterized protein n=2 Tax=Pyrenophora tritici-repentis TaxID=45151 RepID=A0A2W1DFU9_9PLEO|nr:uncharacterized protein PTRG_03188 [Pyrenophora tritici-repentis Pt-1C-BFP]KAI1515068.1 hypothetical protein Ptr86124_006391 [Pyrenophora tritici-repentis]EDU45711.1 predicted protein [Pyrenophora tritici-repentis Pt-1C-BFP]KAI1555239.1 hypothetical protein PtrSN002B_003217 [Pyrenophora tritici-repentis]KAI1672757.1 hypothetical protein L13192_03616 [Pyrenophora tritici-repentis]KAI1686800.1 hypothetical protein KJE20_04765 [Pyrenophora tritici-repentis]